MKRTVFKQQAISGALRALPPVLYAVAMLGAPYHLSAYAAETLHSGVDCGLQLSAGAPITSYGKTHGACAICHAMSFGAAEISSQEVPHAGTWAVKTTGARSAPGGRIWRHAGFNRGPPR